MRSIYSIATLVFACFSLSGFAQTGEIKIKFIGNCGLYLTDDKTNFYIDFPYKSGAHDYMEYDKAEIDSIKPDGIFIFTHRHSDHYSEKILKKLSGQKFDPFNVEELEKLGQSIPDFDIKAFRTDHTVFGISFKHYSYLITWHGKKIYLSGDTTESETFAAQSGIDWTFAPAWLLMDAKEKGIKLAGISQKFAIYHIGPKDKITVDKSDDRMIALDKSGQRISIPY
ncbi:MBL fold metallo-hydrolase [Flavobacterium sp. MAH-1]|uniref:MBL fold metallo-hydrolase n=1 Tax=Flavobacterium agri TaxID=2743471 RepID=A0A7Y9C4U5_9FLAO|nr:MBL fold metallo-hydrolase [Flavobacterium agri]NUY80567.1 MBL fold metallo-hydrolase [Flavobacterium agri]NYA70591.1 MBL fold metallo-hydrolase [Flavobacterium agri]